MLNSCARGFNSIAGGEMGFSRRQHYLGRFRFDANHKITRSLGVSISKSTTASILGWV
ncbi:hypothetical protein OK016_15400 [Vibrio chagasii]|nr:hypothetical protein [Vibrio chagasii]